MDKKKLIGTIIGVAMFAALVAGATYAWLTLAANVTNGNYNTITRNFSINYEGGSELTSLPILTVSTAGEVVNSGASSVTVKAGLPTADALKGDLKLTLVTTSDTGKLATSNVMKYAVSVNGGTPTAPQTISSANHDLLMPDGNGGTAESYLIDSTTQDTIKVYMWIDASSLTDFGQSYSGYIQASAVQRED